MQRRRWRHAPLSTTAKSPRGQAKRRESLPVPIPSICPALWGWGALQAAPHSSGHRPNAKARTLPRPLPARGYFARERTTTVSIGSGAWAGPLMVRPSPSRVMGSAARDGSPRRYALATVRSRAGILISPPRGQ